MLKQQAFCSMSGASLINQIGPVISNPNVMLDAGGNEVSEAPSVLITGDASAATVKLVRQATRVTDPKFFELSRLQLLSSS
jgi:hypothetical protein